MLSLTQRTLVSRLRKRLVYILVFSLTSHCLSLIFECLLSSLRLLLQLFDSTFGPSRCSSVNTLLLISISELKLTSAATEYAALRPSNFESSYHDRSWLKFSGLMQLIPPAFRILFMSSYSHVLQNQPQQKRSEKHGRTLLTRPADFCSAAIFWGQKWISSHRAARVSCGAV